MHNDSVICENLTKFINLEAIIQITEFGGNKLESLYTIFCVNRFYFYLTQIDDICVFFIYFLKFLTIKEWFIFYLFIFKLIVI